MSDMRLIVAGAGGRMGRTLVKAIADTDGAILAGAVDAPGSAVIGRDAGELAGLGPNGIKVTADLAPLLAKADGLVDFTIPAATLALAEIVAQQQHRFGAALGARTRRRDRGPQGRRHRIRVAARRHRGGRPHRGVRRPGRAHRAFAQGRGPHDLRARRRQGGAVGEGQEARTLFDGRCAGLAGFLSRGRPRRPSRAGVGRN